MTSSRQPTGVLRRLLQRLHKNEEGQGLVEYALIIVVVALGSLVALNFLSDEVSNLFNKAGSSIRTGAGASDGGTGGPGGGGTGAGGTPPPAGTPVNGGNGGTPGGGGLPPAGTPGNDNNPVFNTAPTTGPAGFTGSGVQGIFWGSPGDVPPATFPVTVTELGETITVSGCRVHITTPTTFDFYGVWIREPSQSTTTDWRFGGATNYEWACVEAPAFTLVNGTASGASFNSKWTGATVGANITGQIRASSSGNDSSPWYNANTNTAPSPANSNKPGVYNTSGPGWSSTGNYFHPSNGTVWLCYWQNTPSYSFPGGTGRDNGCLAAAPQLPPSGGSVTISNQGGGSSSGYDDGDTLRATTSGWDTHGSPITGYTYTWERSDNFVNGGGGDTCSNNSLGTVQGPTTTASTTNDYATPSQPSGTADSIWVTVTATNANGTSTSTSDCVVVYN